MKSREEKDLLTAWRNGDRSAGDLLVSSCIDSVLHRALAATGGNLAEAKDIVQASFEVALRNRDSIQEGFGQYVRGVCANKIYEYIRNKGHIAGALRSSLCAQAKSPESAVQEQQHQRLVATAMLQLSEEQQKIIYLRSVERLKFREIADLLDITINQASGQCYAAVKRLKAAMRGLAESPDVLAIAVNGLDTWIRSVEDREENIE